MKQRHLGRSGLVVSRLALGTMTWGAGTSEDDAAAQLIAFTEAGGTLVDTADGYAQGAAEQLLGRLLAEVVDRDQVVVATKAYQPTGPGVMQRGTSRGHLLNALDASLRRLRTDHVDLWQLHAWDPVTPYEEALAAIDTAVTSGKVRYAGVSNYCGWQLGATATHQRSWPGRAPLVSNQVEYSLLARGIEREVVPAALAMGVGLLPWSPLGRGVLTGQYRGVAPSDSRAGDKRYAGFVDEYLGNPGARSVVDAVQTAAEGLGVTPVALSLAWVRDRPGVVAPIVGARTPKQLKEALASEALTVPSSIVRALDDVSSPAAGYPEVPRRIWSSPDLETALE